MAVDVASIIKLMELDEYKDMDVASIRRLLASGKLNGQYDMEPDTSSISKIENENVGAKTKQLIDTYRKIDKEPRPRNYGDLAHIMNISMEAPQEYKEPMGSMEYALKYVWSRIPEKTIYSTAQWVNNLLSSGANAMGLDKVGTYFKKNADALSAPPVTKEVDKHIAWLYDNAKKGGKLNEAAFSLTLAATEAISFLTRMGLIKSVPGIGAAIPTGVTMPVETAQMFTGLGTLPQVARHAAVLGTVGMAETPGDFTSKLQGALYRIAYNITPFIANATGAVGWGARATDTSLNMFLSAPSYIKAFKESKNPAEFFVQTIPDFASDVIFAMQTTGTPMNQRLAQMGKIPKYVNMTRTEKITFLDKVDKDNVTPLPYGDESKPLDDKDRLDAESVAINLDKIKTVEKKLNTGEEIKAEDIPTVAVKGRPLVEEIRIDNALVTDIVGMDTRAFDQLINKAVNAVDKHKTISTKQAKQAKVNLHTEKINTLLTPIYGIGKVPPDVTKKILYEYNNWGKKIHTGIGAYITGNRLPENILGMLDNFKEYGPNKKALYLDITTGYDGYTKDSNEAVKDVQRILPPLFQTKKVNHIVTEEKHNIGNGKFFLTDDDAMGVYKATFNKNNLRHLKGTGFSDSNIKQVVDIVNRSPKLLNTISWVAQRYADYFPKVAKVAKLVENIDLPKEDNFSHIVTDEEYKGFNEDNIVQQMRKRNVMKPGPYVEKGIIQERVRSEKPIKLGLIANYLRYSAEAEFYIHMAEPIKAASRILSDSRYRVAVTEKMGKPAIQALDTYLKNVAGTKTGLNIDSVDRVAKLLRRHTGIATMGMNILSFFRQPISAFQAAAEIGLYHVLNGIDQVARHPIETTKFVYKRSIPIAYRAEQFERFTTEEKQAERAPQILTGKKTWRQAALSHIGFIDKGTVIAVWKGTYDRVMATGKTISGERINNADLERVAIMEADRVTRKTQPATAVKDLPGFHRGNVISLLMTQFQNQLSKNLNYFDYDIIGKYRVGEITGGKAAYRTLFAYILPAMVLGMVARGGFPRNRRQIIEDLVKYPLAGAFFVGGLINNAIDDYGEWSPAGAQGPVDIAKAGAAFARGKWLPGTRYTIKGLSEFLGIPYSQLNRTYKGLLAMMNGDVTDWRNLIWSDYALNKGKPKSVGLMPPPTRRKKRKERK